MKVLQLINILTCRICLDDNHSSVVLACAKVVQCILSCDANENFFDFLEVDGFLLNTHAVIYFWKPLQVIFS